MAFGFEQNNIEKDLTELNKLEFHRVADFITTEITRGTFPGAGIIVTCQNTKIYENYFGTYYNRSKKKLQLEPDVIHTLYSFSKGISTTAIVIAHQKHLISYDVPVSHFIPEYCGGYKDATTLRHLLTHGAGLSNCQMGAAYTDEEWQACLSACIKATPDKQPGAETPYHWAQGLFLAAEALRRSMNYATWESICRQLLFDPLGTTSLSFAIPDSENISLVPQPANLINTIDSSQFVGLGHPGAGCFGKLSDIITILQLHLSGGTINGKTLIKPDELKEMHTVQYEEAIAFAEKNNMPVLHEPYALGWLLKRNRINHWFGLGTHTSPQTFGHAGIDTVMSVGDPKRHLAIAFISTATPNPTGENTTRIRNAITDLVVEAVDKELLLLGHQIS